VLSRRLFHSTNAAFSETYDILSGFAESRTSLRLLFLLCVLCVNHYKQAA